MGQTKYLPKTNPDSFGTIRPPPPFSLDSLKVGRLYQKFREIKDTEG